MTSGIATTPTGQTPGPNAATTPRPRAGRLHAGLTLNDAISSVDSLMSILHVGIVYLKLDLTIEYCTAQFAAFIGMDAEDLVGVDLLSLARPGDFKTHPEELLRLLSIEIPRYDIDVRYLRRGGGQTATVTTLALGRDQHERPAYFTALVRSLSERQEALEQAVQERTRELEAERKRFSRLFNESPDAYFVISASDVLIVDCNRGAERMLGVARERIIGQSPAAFEPVLQPDGKSTVALIGEVLARMELDGWAETDMLRRRPDGSEFWVSASVTRTYVAGDAVNLWIWRDISERRRLQDDLEVARQKAEVANLAKSEFLAAMSHEMRTPLNAMINTAYLLQQGPVLPEQKDDLEVIAAAGAALLMVVNDVLDISKIEAGEFSLSVRPFTLAEIIGDTLKLFETPARRKNLALTATGDLPKVPKTLQGDSDCIRHVLNNLLSNAVKFTAAGNIRLTVREVAGAAPPRHHLLRFEVSDTGPGIPADKIGMLFRPFSQADSSTTRKYGGTGLGLFIVKRLVDMMAGRFGVQSQPGAGSTFWFEIPLAAAAGDGGPRDGRDATGITLAFCGGSPADCERLEAICATFGWRLRCVDGPGELESSPAAANDAGPDCVLVGPSCADLPALARGGAVVMAAPELSGAAAPLELFDLMNAGFAQRGHEPGFLTGRTTLRAGGFQWLRGATVMAVDDSGTNLEIIARILESAGATTYPCASGAEAVTTAAAHGAAIDIVLMDLQMPEMDGCEATILIRKLPGMETTPILALTAGATTLERDRALAAGMNDFLTKPINAAQLIRTVRSRVESFRGRLLRLSEG